MHTSSQAPTMLYSKKKEQVAGYLNSPNFGQPVKCFPAYLTLVRKLKDQIQQHMATIYVLQQQTHHAF